MSMELEDPERTNETTALQVALSEIRQLREEQRSREAELLAALRRRDEELAQLRRRSPEHVS